MDETSALGLALFALTSFAAALVAGLAGFAFGLVAAAVWLHLLTPVETTALIVGFGLVVQGVSVWKLRRSLDGRRLLPFLIGGALGVPIGGELLRWASAAQLRMAVGIVLIGYSAWSLARPRLAAVTAGGRVADGAVGVASGMLGSTTGLGGILPTVWCQLRGWRKDEQRAVFQPVAVAIFAMTALWLGGSGFIGRDTAWLFVVGLPAVLAGLWLGLKLFDRLDETGFRTLVLVLLLLSGLALLV